MQSEKKLEEVQHLFKVYEDTLNTIMPDFTSELANILQVKREIINLENNRNPHYSEDFSRDMSRHSPDSKEMVEINLEECELAEDIDFLKPKTEESKNLLCNNCNEVHDLTLRLCKICNEEHDGCCEIVVS